MATTSDEQKKMRAAYMREYWKRNPEKYAAMLKRQKASEISKATRRKRYAEMKADPEKHAARCAAHRASYYKHREKRLNQMGARLYGLTPEEYAHRVTKVPCEICGVLEKRMRKSGCNMHIDHCHTTGKVRGVLCHRCNRGLGMYDDDPAKLEAAAAYLRRYKEEHGG